MKKLLACTAAFILAASMMTACGSSSDDSSSTKETTTTTTTAAETSAAAEEETTSEAAPADTTESAAESEAPADTSDDPIQVETDGTQTVFTQAEGPSDAWAASFGSATFVDENGEESTGTDYIDARSFERDKDMHVVVDFEWTETFLGMIEAGVTAEDQIYMVIGPCYANGWNKFGSEVEGIITDYPLASSGEVYVNGAVDSSYTVDGETILDADGNKPDIYVKDDGFIQVNSTDITQIEFTIPKDIVNQMIDNANAEDGWDGLLMQIGGNFSVTKVTVDEPNVQLASKYVAPDAE